MACRPLCLLLTTIIIPLTPSDTLPPCDSPVFCQGQLLASVQNASIFNDSKVFVDRPLKASPATVLDAFSQLPQPQNSSTLGQFVEQWTEEAGSDLELWDPPDWTPKLSFIEKIKDERLRKWAEELNAIWRQLGRKVKPDVLDYPDRHTLLYLPHPFIIPGGRFRETYYWDTYWIVEGLLLCGMNDTARGMIENLAYMVQQYGLVPNGGRVYYTRRSQPPLLTQMVELYYNTTGNSTFLHSLLPALVTEYEFWVANRSFSPRYTVDTDSPRPEAYREDIALAETVPPERRSALYRQLASGGESGWDFSTRWLAHTGPGAGQLSSINTANIVAVDLSAILCSNEAALSRLFTVIGNESEAAYFKNRTTERSAGFDDMFWNETLGLWKDIRPDDPDYSQNGSFYGSSFAPLIWRCGQGRSLERDEKFLSTLESLGVLEYPGGVPASVWSNSTLQWDYPNAWAPLQWMLVAAWHDSPSETLRGAAEKVARTWVTSTYLAWERHNHTMFEKYNCTEAGEPGGAGEYKIQEGFGWTNAVTLKFLSLYPDIALPSSSDGTEPGLGWVSVIVLLVFSVAVSIPCLLWCRWLYFRGRDRYWGRVRNQHLIAAQGGGVSHSRPHSPPDTTYTNRYADDINGSSDIIYNETLLEFDV